MAGEFDIYRVDLQALACERTLDVFRRSPVIRQIQTVQINQAQELHNAIIDCLPARTLDEAQQANLDVIGRIVGAYPRPLEDAGSITYFGPDNALAAPDFAPAWVTNAPLNGLVPVGDPEYRRFIRAKIAKNSTRYGSAPELQYWAQFAYGATISVRNLGLSDLAVVFAADTPPGTVAAILAVRSDDTADNIYNTPLPTNSRIVQALFKPAGAFAPDLKSGAPDVARAGVGYDLNP